MLDGSTLRIVPADTEAGRFREANCITVTDGERTAVYVAYKAIEPSKKTDAQPPLVADPDMYVRSRCALLFTRSSTSS